MKKKLILALVLSLIPIGYLTMVHLSGGAYSTLGLPLGGDRGFLRQTTLSFIEDIQFKDFDKAASYHEPSVQAEVDIPFLLERIFMLKPEAMDIMEYEIVFAKLDSTMLRGRVKARITCKDLIRNNIRKQEVIYFYHRETIDSPWYMILESSLRESKGNKEKLH